MITRALAALKEVFIPKTEIGDDITVNMDGGVGGSWKVECAIDDEVVNCEGEAFKQDALNYYTGVPAPAYLEDDPWFGPAPIKSEKQLDYMEQETLVKQQQHQETHSVEHENIHEMMYKIASKNWNTVSETQGGSENFQEGPGGWQSGTGMEQFR